MINADLVVLDWPAGCGGQKTGQWEIRREQGHASGEVVGGRRHVFLISFPFNGQFLFPFRPFRIHLYRNAGWFVLDHVHVSHPDEQSSLISDTSRRLRCVWTSETLRKMQLASMLLRCFINKRPELLKSCLLQKTATPQSRCREVYLNLLPNTAPTSGSKTESLQPH